MRDGGKKCAEMTAVAGEAAARITGMRRKFMWMTSAVGTAGTGAAGTRWRVGTGARITAVKIMRESHGAGGA